MRTAGLAIWTIAKWEVRRTLRTMSRDVLPIAIILFIMLFLVTGFTAQSGIHLQDGMYVMGVNDPAIASIFSGDERFVITLADSALLQKNAGNFDLLIIDGTAYAPNTDKARSAMKAIERDYARYVSWVYNQQEDLFAAYPLWLDLQTVKSELDFIATQSGQNIATNPTRGEPVPEKPVLEVLPPSPMLEFTKEELREDLEQVSDLDRQLSRYTDILSPDTGMGKFKTPSQLSPPLPFDSIILIFVFIFPLYFTSQFYMMSIMNERVEQKGEILLSTPVQPYQIIVGKAIPYFIVMLAISVVLTLLNGAPMIILLPLLPVILFFLVNALIIGMVSRSFKELSFISIFFSTIATSYLFFPSIFANVHVVSLISPLTLIVLQLQGEGFTAMEYFYSTSLFYLTTLVLFYVATVNFNEERLFGHHRLLSRVREFIETGIATEHPFSSLFFIGMFTIPFVFMVQLMLLVLLFNLPMPLSLILLLFSAAFVEEFAKSIGIYTMLRGYPKFFTWKNITLASAVIALGFLIGEKALLFATLAQISESVFGSILFSSLQVLWLPLTLHFVGVMTTSVVLKLGGRSWFIPGLMLATIVHSLYNMYFILGWLG